MLEARDRTGGRILTTDFAGGKADVGASWIHGLGPGADGAMSKEWKGRENPVYTLAKKLKLDTYYTWDKIEGGDEIDARMPSGEQPLPPKFWQQVQAVEKFVEDGDAFKAKSNESFAGHLRNTLWKG